MHAQVGDLCFTGDGIAKSGVLLRHLVMPGLEEEGKEIMRWLAQNVGRDLFVNIMEQYRPAAYVGRVKRSSGGKKKVDGEGEEEGEAAAGEKEEGKKEERRYAEINRAVKEEEVESVRKAAERAGLWRFCDPPRHDGFNI